MRDVIFVNLDGDSIPVLIDDSIVLSSLSILISNRKL